MKLNKTQSNDTVNRLYEVVTKKGGYNESLDENPSSDGSIPIHQGMDINVLDIHNVVEKMQTVLRQAKMSGGYRQAMDEMIQLANRGKEWLDGGDDDMQYKLDKDNEARESVRYPDEPNGV